MKGDRESALADLDRALALEPKLVDVLVVRAAIYEDQNKEGAAYDGYDQAISMGYRGAVAFNGRARLRHKRKDFAGRQRISHERLN